MRERKKMAKAVWPGHTVDEERAAFGDVLRCARELMRWDQQEAADALRVSREQIARWEAGSEAAQVWRYWAHSYFQTALLVAMGRLHARAAIAVSLDTGTGQTVRIDVPIRQREEKVG